MIIQRLRARHRLVLGDASPEDGRSGARPGRGDDTGSIPIALLLIFIGMAMSTVLASSVMTQIGTTRTSSQQNRAIGAAQAGIDVTLARLRAAINGTDGDGNPLGSLAKLPCGPLTGQFDDGGARYQVDIRYLKSDPHGHDDAWADSPTNRVTCGANGPVAVPVYALVRSTGTDVPTGDITTVARRTLQATYTFRTTNENIPGGLVYVNKVSGSLDLCLDAAQQDPPAAGAETPAAGTAVLMQTCTPDRPSQKFAYDDSLHLVLVSSKTASNPAGMCLDGGNPQADGTVVTFQQCVPKTTTANRVRQMWSLNDSSNFQGTRNGSDLTGGLCLRVRQVNTRGSQVIVGSCSGATNQVNWSLDPTVGAGMAGPDTGRLVNYAQFGRCIDVTNFQEDTQFLIVWPCKQLPNGTVAWNQLWDWIPVPDGDLSVQTSISTFSTDTNVNRWYCLRSPGASGYQVYVRIGTCTPSNPGASDRWTMYGNTTKDADPGNDDKSYTIVDYRGLCLTPRDPKAVPQDAFPNTLVISKVQVETCNGTTLQMWNAPASFSRRPPLKDIGEKLGS